MRGGDERSGELFSYVDLETRVRKDHPLRAIRAMVNEALAALEVEFCDLYSSTGRPSIAPEKLLRATLLQAFYSIRSERLLMERLEYDLLLRWFVGIGVDGEGEQKSIRRIDFRPNAWDHSSFSKNRDRLLAGDIAAKFLAALAMIEAHADRPRAITLCADRGYDAQDLVNELRSMNVTPHVAQNTNGRRSAIDGRTRRHAGYAASQRIRKQIEETFGWIKTVAGQDKTRFRGRDRVGWAFTFAAAAYNLVRLPKLLAAPA